MFSLSFSVQASFLLCLLFHIFLASSLALPLLYCPSHHSFFYVFGVICFLSSQSSQFPLFSLLVLHFKPSFYFVFCFTSFHIFSCFASSLSPISSFFLISFLSSQSPLFPLFSLSLSVQAFFFTLLFPLFLVSYLTLSLLCFLSHHSFLFVFGVMSFLSSQSSQFPLFSLSVFQFKPFFHLIYYFIAFPNLVLLCLFPIFRFFILSYVYLVLSLFSPLFFLSQSFI